MRVALVGASGILGGALIPRLLACGAKVRSLARSPDRVSGSRSRDHEVEALDLLQPDAEARLRKLLAGCDAVIHAATAIPADPRMPGAWNANTRLRTEGTRALLAAALAAGVGQYVQQSIVMAYTDGGERWLDESAPIDTSPAREFICAPVREMEAMVRAVGPHRMAWSILRGGSFVGPGTAQDRAIAGLRASSEKIIAGGSHYMSPVHFEDVASAFVLVLERHISGAVLNINDEPIRQRDYLMRLARIVNAPAPGEAAGAMPPSLCCSTAKAQETLGWHPAVGIWPTDQQGVNTGVRI